MLAFAAIAKRILSMLLTVLFSGLFGIRSIPSGTGKALPETPADFTPVVRFAVCSDVHLNGDEAQNNAQKFAAMLEDAYAYADGCVYNALDAVLVAGDMTGGGRAEEYASYNRITQAKLREGTQLLTCLGNHEFIAYRDYDASIGYAVYREYISEEVNTHVVCNGYHIIGVSYDDNGKTFTGQAAWLQEQLAAAAADTGDKPIFVFQHPHPFATVYGSVNWADVTIKAVLAQYPQVVDFSGHSHYVAGDPRSVWQGSFTAVGTGAINGLMGNPEYVDDIDAAMESGTYWVVEADADGNVRLQLFDAVNRCRFVDIDYYLTDLADAAAHRYTWSNLRSLDTAPAFPENAALGAARNEAGETVLSFPDARATLCTAAYRVLVKQGAKSVWARTILSDYMCAVEDGVLVSLGVLPAGSYTVQITPVSAYEKSGSPLSGSFTVE